MLLAALLFVLFGFVLVSSLQVLWSERDNEPSDNLSDDGYEAYWNELFRLYAYIFVGIGAAGVVLAFAMMWLG